MIDKVSLFRAWHGALHTLGVQNKDIDGGFFDDVVARYEEPHRKYHNLEHIDSVIKRIETLGQDYDKWTVANATMAAFFHDIVYVPGWDKNERMSAEVARLYLDHIGVSEGCVASVFIERAILSTINHTTTSSGTSALLIDADLYELGTDKYNANTDKIFREFGEPDDDIWQAGRMAFLKSFLSRDRIYILPGQEDLELRAVQNMTAELESLR